MKKATGYRCMCAALVAVLSAAVSPARAAAGEERTLQIYTWENYFDSEVLGQFEKRFSCRIMMDYFPSNEIMYERLRKEENGYDLITPSSYMAQVLDREGMLAPIEHTRIPNLKFLAEGFDLFTEDPGMRYSVPYTRSATGVGYNQHLMPPGAEQKGWNIFADAAYAGRMAMLNDMREALGAALKSLGYSLNTTAQNELDQAGERLALWKKNLGDLYEGSVPAGLAGGSMVAAQAYNGDVFVISEEENPAIRFYIPAEGTSLSQDAFVIVAGSPNKDLAQAFINYLLEPEVAAANMRSIRFLMPNTPGLALLDKALREHPTFAIPEAVLAKCENIRDLGPDNEKYWKIWRRVMGDLGK